jgi:hypothetical protein
MSDYMGGGVSDVTTSTKILCNEKPTVGDFAKGVDYLWNKYGNPAALATTTVPVVPAP